MTTIRNLPFVGPPGLAIDSLGEANVLALQEATTLPAAPETGEPAPIDEEVSGVRRARLLADATAAQRQQSVQGTMDLQSTAPDVDALLAADSPSAQSLGLELAPGQPLTSQNVLEALQQLGLDVGGSLDDPKTQQAISDLKQQMGYAPNGKIDLEFLMSLLMALAGQDRESEDAGGGGGGGPAPSGGGSGGGAPGRASGGRGAGRGGRSSGAGRSGAAGGPRSSSALRKTKPIDTKNWKPGKGDVTPEQIRKIVPGLDGDKAREVAPHLNRAMAEGHIDSPKRKAAFIAQLAHESAGFRYSEEIASGRAYEGRRDLGNTQPGDGVRFKGRGYIQLTGRANYTAASRALGVDFVKNPELAAKPENAARIAAWYWNSRGLNKLADQGDFDGITKRINGGYNGKASRDAYHARAKEVLKDSHGLPSTGTFEDDAPVGRAQAAGANKSEAEKYDHYKKLIEENGGKFRGGAGDRNVVGLRHETNTKANGGGGTYDDKFVMLWKDASGRKHVKEYKGNTEPSSRYEGRYGQDVNGDGRLDLGRLRKGYYEYQTSTFNGGPALRMYGDSKVDRDANHDGKFNDGKTSGGGGSMLFHVGGTGITGSAGCQTMAPAEYRRFWSDLTRDGNPGRIGYTLLHS